MNLKFYMTPGSCSTGIHILLEELELIFEAYIVNLLEGDQDKPEYRAINPKGTIPTLVRYDGSSLTDFQTIAWWLAKQYPKASLLPDDQDKLLKLMDVMNLAINTIHLQGFTRIFTTDKFTPNQTDFDWVRQQGTDIINDAFTIVSKELSETGYVLENFSIADTALFYVEFWADRTGVNLPAPCQSHYERMLGRPKVQQVLREEGYTI